MLDLFFKRNQKEYICDGKLRGAFISISQTILNPNDTKLKPHLGKNLCLNKLRPNHNKCM